MSTPQLAYSLAISLFYSVTANTSLAQIGESKTDLVRRYGQATPYGKILTAQYNAEIDEGYKFSHDGFQILAGLKTGKAVLLMFQKESKTPMSQDEVFNIMRAAVVNPDWILLSGSDPNPRWRLGDLSVYAYYYSGRFLNSPAWFVRIQTARLDAIYNKIREDDAKIPLFEIFTGTPSSTTRGTLSLENTKPLLTVWKVREAALGIDGKGVRIHLEPNDAKKFAELTRAHNGSYLVLQGNGEALEVMHITGPIEAGYLGFKYPAEEKAAAYFRKRLGIEPR